MGGPWVREGGGAPRFLLSGIFHGEGGGPPWQSTLEIVQTGGGRAEGRGAGCGQFTPVRIGGCGGGPKKKNFVLFGGSKNSGGERVGK